MGRMGRSPPSILQQRNMELVVLAGHTPHSCHLGTHSLLLTLLNFGLRANSSECLFILVAQLLFDFCGSQIK